MSEVVPITYFFAQFFLLPCNGISCTIDRFQPGIKHRLDGLHALITGVAPPVSRTAINTKLNCILIQNRVTQPETFFLAPLLSVGWGVRYALYLILPLRLPFLSFTGYLIEKWKINFLWQRIQILIFANILTGRNQNYTIQGSY